VNGKKTYSPEKPSPASRYSLHFFAEGGNLVSGLQSKVAFTINDRFGKGVAATGAVVSENGEIIVSIRTWHEGMGSFIFTPRNGQHYRALCLTSTGDSVSAALPEIYTGGTVMELNGNNGKVSVRVRSTTPSGPVYLFVHTRELTRTARASSLVNGSADFSIDESLLGEGVSIFTVFNADRQPVCERLYFRYPSPGLSLKLSLPDSVFGPRQKVDVQLATDLAGPASAASDLSLAIYRIDSFQPPDPLSIEQYLWLSADLPGAVENPSYYFNLVNDSVRAAMDLLMMTRGWRKFSWSETLSGKKPVFNFIPEYHGHFIEGRIITPSTQRPGSNIEAYLSAPGRRTQFKVAEGDDSGRVKFEMKDFAADEIIVQTNVMKDSLKRVLISSPFWDQPSANQTAAFSIPAKDSVQLLERFIAAQALNIYAEDKLSQTDSSKADSSSFYVKPDVSYLLDNYTRFTTMEEILREYIPLVFVRRREGRYHFSVYDRFNKALYSADPLVLLDGVPVFDLNKFMKYDPLKIWKLDLVANTYYYSELAFDGILNFITYRGDIPDYELDPNATLLDYEGLQQQREFYSPVYDSPQQISSRLPDLRSLLYWSPTIKTFTGQRSSCVFYTSDLPGKYAATIQGVSADGHSGSATIIFEVKEKK